MRKWKIVVEKINSARGQHRIPCTYTHTPRGGLLLTMRYYTYTEARCCLPGFPFILGTVTNALQVLAIGRSTWSMGESMVNLRAFGDRYSNTHESLLKINVPRCLNPLDYLATINSFVRRFAPVSRSSSRARGSCGDAEMATPVS